MAITGFTSANYLAADNLPRGPAGPWWHALFFKSPSNVTTQATDVFLTGSDFDGNGNFTGGNDAFLSFQRFNATSTIRLSIQANRGGQGFQIDSSVSNRRDFDFQNNFNDLQPSKDFFIIYGQREVSSTWRSFKAWVEVSSQNYLVYEVYDSDDNGTDYQDQSTAEIISRIGQNSDEYSSTAIEAIIMVNEEFPWDTSADNIDTSVVNSLFDGSTDYSNIYSSVGAVAWYYPMSDANHLDDATGNEVALSVVGTLSTGTSAIAPWLKSSLFINNNIANNYWPISDFSNKTSDPIFTVSANPRDGGLFPTLEARITSATGSAVTGYDWGENYNLVQVSNFYSFDYSNLPAGGPYTFLVRNVSSVEETAESTTFYSGYVAIIGGQSQMRRLSNELNADTGVSSLTVPNTGHLLRAGNDEVAPENISFESVPMPSSTSYVNMANTFYAATSVPLMAIQWSFGGRSIGDLFNLPNGVKTSNDNGANLYEDIFVPLVRQNGNRVNDMIWYQGTSDVNASAAGEYTSRLSVSRDKLASVVSSNPSWYLIPMPRQTNSDPQNLREIQISAALNLTDFSLFHFGNDLIMDQVDGTHPASTNEGNVRLTTRIADGISFNRFNTGINPLGPGWVNVRFDSSVRDSFTLNATTSLLQIDDRSGFSGFDIRVNSSAWVSARGEASIAFTSTNKGIRFTKLSGNWSSVDSLEIRYQHGEPFNTPEDYTTEASALEEIDRLVSDNRGNAAQPIYPGVFNTQAVLVAAEIGDSQATGRFGFILDFGF